MSAPTNLLPFAIAAARRGWSVFPLRTRAKTPVRTFTDWERHATRSEDAIAAHWGRHPAHNLAVATGPSGLVVIDLDIPKDGETAPPEWVRAGITNGADVLAALAEEHAADNSWLETFTVTTRRGGTHLYYAAPDNAAYRNTAGKLGWLIDTRATGGYVVGPGSYVADTDGRGGYEITDPTAAVAPLPGWLATLLEPARRRPVTSGQVHQALGSRPGMATYASRALRGEVDRVLRAKKGRRNHALNQAAFAVGTLVGAGMLPKHMAEDELTNAASRIGLEPAEIEDTVHSGIQAGIRRPRGAAA